ncbi:MAG: response receiver sensor histidine kinase response regulator [Candidatus Brocadiaceae bacterium]|nr:response receiver sensor histidine kinase response regulator [Candidatus Brocadiaceae bacterium]
MPNPFNKDKLLLWWLPVAIAIIGSIASFYCWTLLDNREHEYIRQIIRSDVGGAADKSARLMKERIFSLQRIADRWIARGGTPQDEWLADTVNHVKHYSCFQAIEWIDPTSHVRWIAPREGNEPAQDLDITFEANRKAALEEAKELNEVCITRNVDLVQGGKGCIIFVPLYVKERFDGFIAGVLNYQKFFAADLADTISSHYAISVYEGDEKIYVLNASDYPDTTGLSQSVDIAFHNKKWRFEASPLSGYLSQKHPLTDKIFFPTGVAIAFLTAGIIYLYQKKNHSEKYVKHSEDGLKIAQGIAHVGSWVWNIVDNSEVWSDEQFRIFGYEPGTIVANYDLFLNALHPEDKEKVTKAVHETLHNNVPYQIECRIVRPTNETRIIYAQGSVYRDNQGKPIRMVGTVQDITGYKRLEDEIRAIARLPAESPNPIIRLAHDGKVLFSNKAGMFVLENCGCYTTQPCKVGDTVAGKWLEYINKALETNDVFKGEEVVSKHIFTLTFVLITEQKYVNIYGVDITERRQTEEKLRKITEAAFDAIIMIDDDGIINYWNHAAETMFGYTQAEAMGKDVHKLVVPAGYKEDYQQGMMQFKATGTGAILGKKVVLQAQKKDGTPFYAEHSFASFQSNNRWNAVSIIRDYTERKQYEEELKRLNETLEQRVAGRTKEILVQNEKLGTLSKAVEQSSTCIVITDSNGNIEYVNPQFIELTGYTLADAKGQNPRILKSGQTPTERFNELWKTITAGKTWHGEFINKKKNGEIYYELGTISPIKNAEGKITHFVAIKNDISGIKSLEAERKRLEDQLSHAQKLESIGKLAGGIAHDFNNMLMAVVGYSNLIEMELKDDNPLRNYTKKILDLTEKSKRLTQSLLTFGRRQPLYLSAVDLNDIIRDMEPLLFKAFGERIRCEMPLSEKSIAIKADSSKLEQVVMNIFINAVEAMPTGGRLTIRTAVTELDGARAKTFGLGAAGAYALLSITDTGIGMDEATQEKIFEPFFTTKLRGKGTGLGLSIAYGIVKQHNGALEVASKPGKGTTFNMYLPISGEKLKKSVAEETRNSPPISVNPEQNYSDSGG